MRVFRPVARASLRIMIGSVLPHLQAGFGGGYKLIFPGTSHRTTLGALHRQGIDGTVRPGAACSGALPRVTPCGRRSTRRRHDSGRAGRSAIWPGAGAGFPDRRGASRARAGSSWRTRRGDGFRHPRPRRQTWLWREMIPGRATRCRVSRCCFIIARPAGREECLPACSGRTPTRSTARFPINALRRIAATGRLGGWAIRRLLPVAQRHRRGRRIAGGVHAALGARAGRRPDRAGLCPTAYMNESGRGWARFSSLPNKTRSGEAAGARDRGDRHGRAVPAPCASASFPRGGLRM